MRFNPKKFFELAKEKGIEHSDVGVSHSRSTSFSIYHQEVESFSQNETFSIDARGIVNGKFGTAYTEVLDKNTYKFLVDAIYSTGSVIDADKQAEIFEGSKKYHKKNFFKAKPTEDFKERIELAKEIERRIRAFDPRIAEVASVGYSENFSDSLLANSYGLNLKNKGCSFEIYAEVTAKDGDEVKTGFKVFADHELEAFDIDTFVKEVAEEALNKIGAVQCKSKKYPTVLSPETFTSLLKAYLSNMNAEEVQKNSSLFVGKLHEQVASKKLTVVEDGLVKNVFYRYHDDEGVAINKKNLITKGVLETYLYTLETAKKDGVEPTGNAVSANKMVAVPNYFYVKPGKKTFEDMIKNIKEGVYITDLQGLHAAMNAKSGNFSLQAQGFMIRDGKVAEPLTLITAAGNLVDVFNNIKDIASDLKLCIMDGCSSPSVYIKKMAISGK